MLDGLPQVMWFIRRHMRRNRSRALSVPQFRTLVLLDRYPTASLSAVAEHLGFTLPTASRLVTGMVGKGLVTREECPDDRRQKSLGLTARGRAALNAARRETQDRLADAIAHLGDAQRTTIYRAMALLRDAFAGTPMPGAEACAPVGVESGNGGNGTSDPARPGTTQRSPRRAR